MVTLDHMTFYLLTNLNQFAIFILSTTHGQSLSQSLQNFCMGFPICILFIFYFFSTVQQERCFPKHKSAHVNALPTSHKLFTAGLKTEPQLLSMLPNARVECPQGSGPNCGRTVEAAPRIGKFLGQRIGTFFKPQKKH
jgi:hypothetical protein